MQMFERLNASEGDMFVVIKLMHEGKVSTHINMRVYMFVHITVQTGVLSRVQL